MIKLDPKWLIGGGAVAATAAAAAVVVLMRAGPAPQIPPGGAAPNDVQASAPAPACTDSTPTPLQAADIEGVWTDKEGKELLRITQVDPNDPTRFNLKGHHDWEGTLAEGKLTFTRNAIASEMDREAPDWARQQVDGQIEWSMELEANSVCEASGMRGKWYPGRIKVEQTQEPDGSTVAQGGEASSDGKGEPRDVEYIKAPKILVFAEGTLNSFLVDKLYVGVPMSVGVVFESAFDKPSYPVRVIVGGQKLALNATPANDERTLFKTAVFTVKP